MGDYAAAARRMNPIRYAANRNRTVSKLKRIRREAIRFGDAEFDRDYMEWGFHDQDTQIGEAQAVLNILQLTKPVNILDLACGVGTHAIHWARQGHRVTGVDISETFILPMRDLRETSS